MRKVRLTSSVKLDSPPVCGDDNAELTLPTGTAVWLVHNKLAVWVGNEEINPEVPGPTRAELEAQEEFEAAKRQNVAQISEILDVDNAVTGPDGDNAVEPPKKPYGNAPKSAWIRYAVAVDPELTEERAETLTKADLMSQYGSRLGDEE